MNNYAFLAKEIKERVSTKDLLSFYGVAINSRGFCKCPFHNERTASMKVYDGIRGYNCFGCGANGDSIKFVQEYFALSFGDALKKINTDFCLNLPLDGRIDRRKQRKIAQRAFELKKEKEKKDAEKKAIEKRYWDAYDEVLRLEGIRDQLFPTNENDIDPRFVEAVHQLGIARENLQRAEGVMYECEKCNN